MADNNNDKKKQEEKKDKQQLSPDQEQAQQEKRQVLNQFKEIRKQEEKAKRGMELVYNGLFYKKYVDKEDFRKGVTKVEVQSDGTKRYFEPVPLDLSDEEYEEIKPYLHPLPAKPPLTLPILNLTGILLVLVGIFFAGWGIVQDFDTTFVVGFSMIMGGILFSAFAKVLAYLHNLTAKILRDN